MKELLFKKLLAVVVLLSSLWGSNMAAAKNASAVANDGYVVYVDNQTSWNEIALYMWGEVNDLVGGWPGMLPTGNETINGVSYTCFALGSTCNGKTENLIFNNNNKGTQLKDFNFTINRDLYLRATDSGVEEIEPNASPIEYNDNDYVSAINSQTYGNGQQVIYEMNVGMFTTEGTLVAAQQKLEGLKKLGIDIVWLMPIYPRDGSLNSPYAAIDFKKVNPSYGTVTDLKNFVAAAHALGMKVWLDWVPNHTSTIATWVTTHPEYYKKSNGSMIHPNGYGDVYQLDYTNSGLVAAMNDCLKFWIDEADIDGYRCDYISSPDIPVSYWQSTIPMLKSYKAGKKIVMLGESDFTDSNNARLKEAGFDYDYAWGFQSKLIGYGSGNTYVAPLRRYAEDLISDSKSMNVSRMLYLTNHDQNWNETAKTLTAKYGDNRYLLTVYASTIWGMPLIYNGQEIGGNQALNYFTDTKIDWSKSDGKMRNTLRTLAAIKHTQKALFDAATPSENADVNFLTTNNNQVLAYKRTHGDSEVLVILNAAATAQQVTLSGLAGTYSLWLDSETIAKGVSRHNENFNGTLSKEVEGKGYLVYVKGHFSEEEIATGFRMVKNERQLSADNSYYNLSGQKVSFLSNGILIHQGRKYIVRNK